MSGLGSNLDNSPSATRTEQANRDGEVQLREDEGPVAVCGGGDEVGAALNPQFEEMQVRLCCTFLHNHKAGRSSCVIGPQALPRTPGVRRLRLSVDPSVLLLREAR